MRHLFVVALFQHSLFFVRGTRESFRLHEYATEERGENGMSGFSALRTSGKGSAGE